MLRMNDIRISVGPESRVTQPDSMSVAQPETAPTVWPHLPYMRDKKESTHVLDTQRREGNVLCSEAAQDHSHLAQECRNIRHSQLR